MNIKNNYYSLIAGLPEVSWDDRKLSLTVNGFRELAREDLKEEDMQLVDLFFLPVDHVQLLRLLTKMGPDPELPTLFSVNEMEEEIAVPNHILLPYMNQFVADYKEGELKYDATPENVLSRMYYDYMMASENRFVREYAEFSMNVRNLVVALNSRKYKRDIGAEVIGDNEFSQALRTAVSKDFGLSQDYPYVEKVLALMANPNLVERERGLDLLYWDFIDESVVFEYFTIERVLSFLLELMIVERWSKMSTESGRKVFMEMVDRFRKSFEFTEDFK